MLHDGVMRRSVARDGSFDVDCVADAVEMMTETSAGVAWKAILPIVVFDVIYSVNSLVTVEYDLTRRTRSQSDLKENVP